MPKGFGLEVYSIGTAGRKETDLSSTVRITAVDRFERLANGAVVSKLPADLENGDGYAQIFHREVYFAQ